MKIVLIVKQKNENYVFSRKQRNKFLFLQPFLKIKVPEPVERPVYKEYNAKQE